MKQRILCSALVGIVLVFLTSSVFAAASSTKSEKSDNQMTMALEHFVQKAPDMSNYHITFKTLHNVEVSADKGYLLIDVRDEQAFSEEHISDAVNVPLPQLVAKLSTFPKEQPIYVIGDGEIEASYATAVLRILDYHAWIVEGGLDSWKMGGFPLEKTST